jgi:hypothetical protein
MRIRALAVVLTLLALGSPALAHHISGTVYCDQDSDGVIDVPGDTPIIGVAVLATSLDVSPGQEFSDGTDGSGFYNIPLPARTDRYRVELIGLPGGFSVVVPGSGSYVIQIITASSQDHADGVNFLVQGCAPVPTTTTSTTSSSTTSTVPTSSTSSSTTSSTTTSSTTTTLFTCNCPAVPFLVARDAKVNNDGTVSASFGASNPGGRVRFSRDVTMPDGTSVIGDTVVIGVGSSVSQVLANTPAINPRAVVRNGTGVPVLPIINPFCSLPPIACGTDPVQVSPGDTLGPLAPGMYGSLRVMNGARLLLDSGEFTFCDIKMGRNGIITTAPGTLINVTGNVTIGSGSRVGPATGTEPVMVNVAGRSIRVSQGAVANAGFVGPAARISFGRDSLLLGCFCTDKSKSDKHITLACPTP